MPLGSLQNRQVADGRNYGGGAVVICPLRGDSRLGEAAVIQHKGSSINRARQRGPHPHSVVLSADNRFLFVPDLGLDQVMIYRLDPLRPSLTANDPPFAKVKPGSGPRHIAFHPNGKYAHVVNEMASTVTAFAYDRAQGALRELQSISTLPGNFTGKSTCAERDPERWEADHQEEGFDLGEDAAEFRH